MDMIHEGTECVTTSYGKVRGAARRYQYFQPATYVASRLASGELVWRYAGHVCRARRNWRLTNQDAATYAEQHNILLLGGIRQWSRIAN
jgi:hypothetical protein